MQKLGRLGDSSKTDPDVHDCPACPHVAIGPAVIGSPNVNVNTRPALRVGDVGFHAICCGPNTWTAIQGSPTVLINYRRAFRSDDAAQHCGGMGRLTEGSPDVFVGDRGSSATGGAGSSAGRAASQARRARAALSLRASGPPAAPGPSPFELPE